MYGGIRVDSSEERAGPEDCSHTGIEHVDENVVDCRKIGTEDCRTGGHGFRRMSGSEEMLNIICVLSR